MIERWSGFARRAGIAVLGVVATGCYTYRPVELAQVTPETEVRARITAQEADRLSDVLPDGQRLLAGTVESVDNGELLLLVPIVGAADRPGRGAINQRLALANDGVIEVEVREIDNTRTGIMLATVTAAIGALVIRELTANQSDTGEPDVNPPPESTILRFFLPW